MLSFVLGFVLSERVDRHPAFAAEDENMARSTPLIRVALSLHDVLTEGTGVLVDSLSAWVVEARERAVLEEDDETGTSHLVC